MENIENEPLQKLHNVSNALKEQKVSFFEVNRTPPDEKRRKERAAELAAAQVPEVLMLTPFTSSPRVEFERIKLGRSGVRSLVVRNPGDKPIEVVLEKLPKEDKGFSIDYVAFRLGGREETTLLIGWTPVKGGGVRDNFIVKFGKFSAQVILIGSCVAPEVKPSKSRPPIANTRPLAPKNTNVRSGPIKSRPTVPASKLAATPKIPIPINPVVRKTDSPPKRLIVGVSPLKPQNSPKLAQPKEEASFVCGREFTIQELPRPEYNSPRRETFVHERPPPRGGDVVESTPIVSSRTGTFRDIRRDTIVVGADYNLEFGSSVMPTMPPPQLTDVRRQTFVPARSSQSSEGLSRRQTYVKLPTLETATSSEEAEMTNNPGTIMEENTEAVNTPEILKRALKSVEINDIPQPDDAGVPTPDTPLNLSLAPLNLSARPKVLTDMLAEFLDNSDQEPINLSVTSKEQADVKVTEPDEAAIASPLNLSVQLAPAPTTPMTNSKLNTPRRYCPQVSDISLPEESPCHRMTPTNTTTITQKTAKDPRLLQLMNSFNISGTGSLDLSMGSQFGDCSLAVNLASPARDREKDLEDELENIEENKEVWDEEELEMIAKARGTSALEKSGASPQTVRTDRLSSGTVVKDAPSLDPVVVPVIGNPMIKGHAEVEERKEVIVLEEEIETNEVIEEVIEYEYEIVGGERRLVGERNLGRTITCQTDIVTRTPLKSAQSKTTQVMVEPECDVSRLIEEQLSGMNDEEARPRAVDLTAEQLEQLHTALPQPLHTQHGNDIAVTKQVFNLSPHHPIQLESVNSSPHPATFQPKNLPPPKSPELQNRQLPGLRGSPRISNQISSHPESFLQVTINETSFLPPSPDDPRRCSTGVKHKENIAMVSPSPNAEVRKSLFSPDLPNPENTQTKAGADESGFVPLNNLGFELPVIESPKGEVESRLSSDTYIASAETPALSTIQETDETDNSKQNGTFEKNLGGEASRPGSRANRSETIVKNNTFDKSKESSALNSKVGNVTFEKDGSIEPVVDQSKEEKLTVIKERTPATPRRSNISYTSQDIATIALSKTSIENLARNEEESRQETGLLFFPISPTQSEKRKPELTARSEQAKRTKTVVQASRPTLRAVKNPVPHRLVAKKVQVAPSASVKVEVKTKKNVAASVKGKGVTKSLPPKPPISRVTQPARRLHLVKPGKPGMVHHPNPFAARNQYYDERWIDKQERGFTKWLNFMLTPQVLEDTEDMLPGKVDVAKLWTQCTKDVKVPRAPTREVMSMRAYTARREMNRLRRAACKIWQSRDVATVIGKVEFEIEKLRLIIRKDRNITKDVGMKQALLKIILSYNPLWLRIGLETVYGELLPVNTNSDLLGLSRFLVTRLLSNPDILAEFAHPTVPHCYREGHQEALNRFALKKFLELVYFLDIAKESRLIRHNPCLFCPDGQFKTSRDVLITFSKDYLSGEGDITKHMAYMGYVVNHKQTKLDEFDYAVTNIKTDLRCGLRLAKVAELVTGSTINSNMRVPAVSRLQKVHNTDVALAAYKEGGLDIPNSIAAKDIVDGHREKTLTLLWTIIFGYQLNTVLDLQKLKEEISHLKRSLSVRSRMGDMAAKAGQAWLTGLKTRSPQQGILAGERLELVMEWAQLVLAHYQVEVENWTVSWCDGRALCLLVHHYQPDLLAREDIKNETSLTHQADHQNLDDSLEFNYGSKTVDSACYEAYIDNEKSNFKLLFSKVSELGGVPILISPGDMSNTIPDEKVTATFIGYLAARLLDLSREIKAARIIQLAWRRFSALKREEELKVKDKAARLIQCQVRIFLARRRRLKYEDAALVIQKYFRGVLGRREARRRRVEEENKRLGYASVIIQTWWRGVKAREERTRRMRAIYVLQAGVRRMLSKRKHEKEVAAVLVLQGAWRRIIAERKAREERKVRERAAVVIQTTVRKWIAQMTFKRTITAVVMIQSMIRMRNERKKYFELRKSTCLIQNWWRAVKKGENARKTLAKQKCAALTIQRYMRMLVARREFLKIQNMVTRLQAISRGWLTRTTLLRRINAAKTVQNWWRNLVKSKVERKKFEEIKRKVVIVQSVLRRYVVRKRYLKMRKATITIQKWVRVWRIRKEFKQKVLASSTIQTYWRSILLARQGRQQFLKQRCCATSIQSWWRMVMARKKYLKMRKATILIQKWVRGWRIRKEFKQKVLASSTIQTYWRSTLLARQGRQQFLKQKCSATSIQSWWRMVMARKKYLKMRKATITIQRWVRGWSIRKEFKQKVLASSLIQTYWRNTLLARHGRHQFIKQRFSAISIQSWWRMVMARKVLRRKMQNVVKIQRLVRTYQERQKYLRVRNAVLVIQRKWRAQLLMKKTRSEYMKKQKAATMIQASWAGYIVRKQARKELGAIVTLQSWWRRRLAQKKYQNMKESISVIQSWWRAHNRARKIRMQMLIERNAAIKVQAVYRGWRVRSEYLKTRKATVKIQSLLRGALQRKKYLLLKQTALFIQRQARANKQRDLVLLRFNSLKNGVKNLQAVWRGERVRREWEIKREAAVRIQAWTRMCIQRKEYLKLLQSTLVVQRRYRRNMQAIQDRSNFLSKRHAAIKIQAWWRMLQCKQSYTAVVNIVIMLQSHFRQYVEQKRFRKLKEATLVLQKRYRLKTEGVKCREQFLNIRKSALVIQTMWRARKARIKFNEDMKMVVMVQTAIRGFLARERVKKIRKFQLETTQAINIQRYVRGLRERRRFKMMKDSAGVIQSWWRRVLLKRREREEFLSLWKAVVTLQAVYRGYLARRVMKEQVRNITKVQAVVRGWLVRKQFLKMKVAATVIQRWTLANRERKLARHNFLDMKLAAVKIQASWKAYMQRKRFTRDVEVIRKVQAIVRGKQTKSKFYHMKSAALCIQSWWRAILAGRLELKNFLRLRSSTLRIQAWWRMVITRRRFLELKIAVISCQAAVRGKMLRNELDRQHKAAAKVQEWIRGSWESRTLQKQFQRKKKAATTIQAVIRGGLERKRFCKRYRAVYLLQRITRGWLVRKEMESWRNEWKTEKAVVTVQRQVRVWLARRGLKTVMEQKRKEKAAIFIQSYVRGCTARKAYQEQRTAGLIIQRWWRSVKMTRGAQTQYLKKKKSTLILQTWWKTVLAKRSFCRQKTAALYIQSWLRSKLAEMEYTKLRMAVMTIQRRWREREVARIERTRYLLMREAAVTIQSWWRGRKYRAQFKEMVRTATTLQRWVRGWLARRYVGRKRAALISLQYAVRRMALARRCRKDFLHTREMVIGLQSRCRGVLARREFLKLQDDQEYLEKMRKEEQSRQEMRKQEAAKTITSVIKTVVVRRRFLKIKKAATTIQKYWRGRWHRKVVMLQWDNTSSRLSILKDIHERLQIVNAAAKPEDCLGARTASAIDYIFSIKDVAQLICAVKTLDFSTRLSLDCCMKMTEGLGRVTPVAQLVSLMTRCNRSVPHMEVVSTILDILLNVARVVLSREAVAEVPNLLPDMFQTMLVYRDSGPEIFSKCCALFQVLSVCPEVGGQLAKGENAKKLSSFESIVMKKKKLKEENQRRRSLNVSSMPAPSRKPLRPANSINNLNRTTTMGLNSTISAPTGHSRPRKPSPGIATGPPWCHETLPRYHEDPVMAIQALNKTVGLGADKK